MTAFICQTAKLTALWLVIFALPVIAGIVTAG